MYCVYCGTALVQGARFCFNCGTPVMAPNVAPPLPAPSGSRLTDPLAVCVDALALRSHGASNRPLMDYLAGLLRATPDAVPGGEEYLAAFQMCWDAGLDAPTLAGTFHPVGPVRDVLVVLFDDRLSLAAVTDAGPALVKVLKRDAIWDSNELHVRLGLAKTPAMQASTTDGVTLLLFFPPSLPSDAVEAMHTELYGWLTEAADSNAGISPPDDVPTAGSGATTTPPSDESGVY